MCLIIIINLFTKYYRNVRCKLSDENISYGKKGRVRSELHN
jgi:hypothetical protein